MRQSLVAAFCAAPIVAVAGGCGGKSRSPVTEAEIQFKHPTALATVLELAKARSIRPTQLMRRDHVFPGETMTGFFPVRPGMTDDQIAAGYRRELLAGFGDPSPGLNSFQRARLAEVKRQIASGPALVDHMTATGRADALKAAENDPLVRRVFVRP